MGKRLEDLSWSQFWRQIAYETKELAKKYPELDADQEIYDDGSCGEWKLVGPYMACTRFADIAELAARKLGYKGGRHGAVQFWLDHMNGNHMQHAKAQGRQFDESEATVTMADNSKEVFRGRQKQG